MFYSLHNWQWLVDILDILLLAYVIYRLMLLVRGAMAWRVMFGLIVLLVCHSLFHLTGFRTVTWLLDNLLGSIVASGCISRASPTANPATLASVINVAVMYQSLSMKVFIVEPTRAADSAARRMEGSIHSA